MPLFTIAAREKIAAGPVPRLGGGAHLRGTGGARGLPAPLPRGAGGPHRRRAHRGGARPQLLRRGQHARACRRAAALQPGHAARDVGAVDPRPGGGRQCAGRDVPGHRRGHDRRGGAREGHRRQHGVDGRTWTSPAWLRGALARATRDRSTPSTSATSRCASASEKGLTTRQPETPPPQGAREALRARLPGHRVRRRDHGRRRPATASRCRSSASSGPRHVGRRAGLAVRAGGLAAGDRGAGPRRGPPRLRVPCGAPGGREGRAHASSSSTWESPWPRSPRAARTSSSPSSTARAAASTSRWPRPRRAWPSCSGRISRCCPARRSRAYWGRTATRWPTFPTTVAPAWPTWNSSWACRRTSTP